MVHIGRLYIENQWVVGTLRGEHHRMLAAGYPHGRFDFYQILTNPHSFSLCRADDSDGYVPPFAVSSDTADKEPDYIGRAVIHGNDLSLLSLR